MKKFNDLSIRTRLTIVFTTMSVIIVAVGLFGLLVNASQAKTVLLILLIIVGAVVSTVFGKIVSNSIYKPIRKLTEAASKLADGDTSVMLSISTKDEIGFLAATFQKFISALKAMITDTELLADAASNGIYTTRADESAHHGDYRVIIEAVNKMLDEIITPLNEFTTVIGNMSVNNLTISVAGQYKGKPNEVAQAINQTLNQMKVITRGMLDISKGSCSMLPAFEKVGKLCEEDQLTPAAIKLMQTINLLVDEASKLSGAVVDGNLDNRSDAVQFQGRFKELIEGMNGIMDAMALPLNETMIVLDHMAQFNLTGSVVGQYKGAFADLAQSINSVIDTMNQTMGDISTSAEQVAAGTQQVSAGSQALSQGATEQASSIEELTASLSEIAGQTRQNAINAGQASDLARAARDSAADGKVQMSELQQAMTAINESSANISKIIKVIDEIAFQTNLLALNAAVEAARAGQHGKGFAVVAEEVRNLAQRSANAAKETTEMIEGSIKKVQAGTQIANDTATALVKIVGSVEKATELVGGIAKASNDQAMAVAQVNTGIEQVSQVTQTNSATAEESAAASEELSSQAALLKEMVGRFSLRGQAHIGGQKASFQPQAPTRSLGAGKPTGKPKITLNDREFGKY